MTTRTTSKLLLTALLIWASAPVLEGNFALAASESTGSGLPPGIDPSSPAGGNGSDAQGYDKKPIAPAPAGTQPKASEPSSSGGTTTPRTERKHSDPDKKNEVKNP